MGYDPAWRVLEIEFRDTGEIYLYYDVPAEEYEALRQALSKGTYLNQTFKKKGYQYEPVPPTGENPECFLDLRFRYV
jgi:KTSC domain